MAASGCQAQYEPDNVHQPHVQQPSTYENPEAASAVWASDDGRCVARNMLSFV